jgi:hypothetical protein
MTAHRLAVMSDVHGNIRALAIIMVLEVGMCVVVAPLAR